jgi:hypothetical protein
VAFPPRPDKQPRPIAAIGGDAGDTEPSPAYAVDDGPTETPTLSSLAAQIAAMQRDLRVAIRHSSSPPEPEPPRSSIRVAATTTAQATKIGMAVLGGSAVAAEFIAAHYPHVIGPLGALAKILLRLLGDGVSP